MIGSGFSTEIYMNGYMAFKNVEYMKGELKISAGDVSI
jgi:hypothetical protein